MGVSMSERMGFGVHVKELYGRVMNVLSGLRRVMRIEWGLRGRTVRMIYKELLTAYVMYGAVTWHEYRICVC